MKYTYYLIGIMGLFSANMWASHMDAQGVPNDAHFTPADGQELDLSQHHADLILDTLKQKAQELKNWATKKVQTFTDKIGACPAATKVIREALTSAVEAGNIRQQTIEDRLNAALIHIKQKIYDLGLCKPSVIGTATQMVSQFEEFLTDTLQGSNIK
jgi:hypothetical protein